VEIMVASSSFRSKELLMGNTNSSMARISHVALLFPFQSFKSFSYAEFGAPIGSGFSSTI
jgi:ADP-ribosylglycohydrolase